MRYLHLLCIALLIVSNIGNSNAFKVRYQFGHHSRGISTKLYAEVKKMLRISDGADILSICYSDEYGNYDVPILEKPMW